MATKLTLTNISSGFKGTDIQSNFTSIEDEFDKCLYRTGDSPNQMEARLDMNSFSIENLGIPSNNEGAARLKDVLDNADSLTTATAVTTTVDDTKGHYSSTNVEAVLEEIFEVYDPEHATDSGTDTYVSATNTTPPADGVQITRDFQSANTTTTPTLDAKTMTTRDGSALWPGAVSGPHELQYASGTDTYLVLEPRVANVALDARWFASIQAAVDAVPTASITSSTSSGTLARSQVFVPGAEYDETVDLGTGFEGSTLFGMGVGSHIWSASSDHACDVSAQNINLNLLWIDHTAAAGNFDAVHVTATECRLTDMDVDYAPRHAIYVNASGCKIVNTEVTGGGKTSGITIDSSAAVSTLSNIRLNSITHGASPDALVINANQCLAKNIAIIGCDGRGIVIAGSRNSVSATISGTTGNAVEISGDDNHVTGVIGGDIVISGNNNVIDVILFGGGTVTDNGNGNAVNNFSTLDSEVDLTNGGANDLGSVTFTSIKPGAKRIVLLIHGMSSTTLNNFAVTIGDSGGLEATGYSSRSMLFDTDNSQGRLDSSTSFGFHALEATADTYTGAMTLERMDNNNTWIARFQFSMFGAERFVSGTGSKSLSGELTQLRLSAGGGNFDEGDANILVE